MHQPTSEKNANVVFKKKLKKFNVYLVEDERKPIVRVTQSTPKMQATAFSVIILFRFV